MAYTGITHLPGSCWWVAARPLQFRIWTFNSEPRYQCHWVGYNDQYQCCVPPLLTISDGKFNVQMEGPTCPKYNSLHFTYGGWWPTSSLMQQKGGDLPGRKDPGLMLCLDSMLLICWSVLDVIPEAHYHGDTSWWSNFYLRWFTRDSQ
jgi:hypothetical protein